MRTDKLNPMRLSYIPNGEGGWGNWLRLGESPLPPAHTTPKKNTIECRLPEKELLLELV